MVQVQLGNRVAATQVGAGLDVEHGQRLRQPVVVVLRVRELLEDCLGHMLHLHMQRHLEHLIGL